MAKITEQDKQLIAKTQRFARETPSKSVAYTLTAHGLFNATATLTAITPYIVVKLIFSVLAGLVLLRCFVIYHDYMHGSILRKSKWASGFFRIFSVIYLTPKAVWRETHNYHHAHCSKVLTSHIGSYKIVTKKTWQKMNTQERYIYKFLRHPFNMLAGIITVFFLGMIIAPMFRNIKKNIDALYLLIAYAALSTGLLILFGHTYFFSLLLPQAVAGSIGAYLFYAQHNFPTTSIKSADDWNYVHAALHSSSFMDMSPIMHWFTANIGYHHIHHLNARIPFYRLPEAMKALPELHPQHTTSLSLKNIKACLKAKVWDEEQQKFIAYP